MSYVEREQEPAYLLLDLWMALGFDSREFNGYYEAHGVGATWGALLDVVRGPRASCAAPVDDGDWCVRPEGHSDEHYGAGDVGPPNELMAKYYVSRAAKR